MPESMSRPWSSVPSQYIFPVDSDCSPGASLESITSSCARSYGFWGEMSGAASARKTIATRRPRPIVASRLAANSAAKRRQGDSARATAGTDAGSAAATRMGSVRRGGSAEAHARIEHRVDDVDHEVDGDEDRDRHEEVGDDDGSVELVDGIDQQLAAAGPGEDRFGDDREGDHGAQLQPDHRDDRDQDVLEHVDADHPPGAKSLGAGELHVVLQHRLARAGARQANQERELEERKAEGLHREVRQPVECEEAHRNSRDHDRLAAAVGRQPAELHREDHYEHEADPERRQAETEDGAGHDAAADP